MPMQSQAQERAMFAAKEGKSTLGIPKSVGEKMVADSAGQSMSVLPEHVQAQQGFKKKSRTHRGRRGRGKKAAKAHHEEGKQHLANAQKATTPAASLGHLFKAIRSMHAAKSASMTAQ